MVAATYTITVVSEKPPQVYIGDRIGGAEIVELKRKDDELLSSSQLAKLYGISTQTVRRKLAEHNQGGDGKKSIQSIDCRQYFKSKKNKNSRG